VADRVSVVRSARSRRHGHNGLRDITSEQYEAAREVGEVVSVCQHVAYATANAIIVIGRVLGVDVLEVECTFPNHRRIAL